MEHNLPQTIALLTRTPATLNALLRDLPETWTFRNEGENTWSALDVVGHLIHGERTDWMPRAKMVLQFGETKAFEPFDRLGHVRESQSKSLVQLLDEFARLRSENLDQLRAFSLRQEDLDRRGRHPALGVVTLSDPPIPRSGGSVERVPWSAAVRRPQRSLMNSPALTRSASWGPRWPLCARYSCNPSHW